MDLEQDLPEELIGRFDVVFNHTVLEHVFEIEKAFKNLCLMSRDVVIVVMPFLQQMHTDYGDYWRMTPLAVKKMFEKNKMHLQYLSFNDHHKASVYVFAIAVKNKEKWQQKIPSRIQEFSIKKAYDGFMNYAGSNAMSNLLFSIKFQIARFIRKKQG